MKEISVKIHVIVYNRNNGAALSCRLLKLYYHGSSLIWRLNWLATATTRRRCRRRHGSTLDRCCIVELCRGPVCSGATLLCGLQRRPLGGNHGRSGRAACGRRCPGISKGGPQPVRVGVGLLQLNCHWWPVRLLIVYRLRWSSLHHSVWSQTLKLLLSSLRQRILDNASTVYLSQLMVYLSQASSRRCAKYFSDYRSKLWFSFPPAIGAWRVPKLLSLRIWEFLLSVKLDRPYCFVMVKRRPVGYR